jgi:transcriptional regulator with GAF, ATPase, and Fis domain
MANTTEYRIRTPSERPDESLGASEVFLRFQQQVARVAGALRPVILIGERGTRKELAAARIHYLSPRWSGPFIKLNCAALAASVLESELFGHEAGRSPEQTGGGRGGLSPPTVGLCFWMNSA